MVIFTRLCKHRLSYYVQHTAYQSLLEYLPTYLYQADNQTYLIYNLTLALSMGAQKVVGELSSGT